MAERTAAKTQIVPLVRERHAEAGQVLARAFFDDPLSVYLLPDGAKRARLLPWMYERVVRYAAMYDGEVLTTPAVDGVAAWLPPGLPYTPVLRLLRAGLGLTPFKFGLGAMGRFMAANHVERLRKQHMPQPHWYLWVIGVEPERQGQGIGTALLGPVLERAAAEASPCYLETHKERNVAFYRQFGFELVTEGTVPNGGPRFWTMRREPKA